MNNSQARLLASAIGIVGGAIAANTDNMNVNVGLSIITICAVLFLAEHWSSRKI